MADTDNQQVIDEFRANGGRVGGRFEGVPLLLLTTAGAKTYRPHTTPVGYARDGDRLLVSATGSGPPRQPDWYRNLLADPHATVEMGTEDGRIRFHAVRAEVLEGAAPVIALTVLDLTSPDPGRNRYRAIGAQLLRHHGELRAELARIRTEVDALLAGRPAGAGTGPGVGHELLRHCLTFCNGLQMHHIREDGAFTAIEELHPELGPALDRIRAEHRVVNAALAGLRTLIEGITPDSDPEIVRAELERLAGDMERHFAHEEHQLLPTLGTSAS